MTSVICQQFKSINASDFFWGFNTDKGESARCDALSVYADERNYTVEAVPHV